MKKTSKKKTKAKELVKKEMSKEETESIIRDISDLSKLTAVEKVKSEAYEFLSEKLLSDDDLEQKTDINSPSLFSALDVYIEWFEDLGLHRPAKRMKDLKTSLMKHLIAKKRLGRKELVECVKALGLPVNTDNLNDIRKRGNIF